jgi:hypothetical protein
VNDVITKSRTKLELLQALARRHSGRARLALKTPAEPEAPLRAKMSAKVILART